MAPVEKVREAGWRRIPTLYNEVTIQIPQSRPSTTKSVIPRRKQTQEAPQPTGSTPASAPAGSKEGSSSKGPSCDNVRSKTPKQVSVDAQKTVMKVSKDKGAISKQGSSSKKPMHAYLPAKPSMQTKKPTTKMIHSKEDEPVEGECARSAQVLGAGYRANLGVRHGDYQLRMGHALTNPEPRRNMTFWNARTEQFETQGGSHLWEYGQGPARMHTVPDAKNIDAYHDKVNAVQQAALLKREQEAFTRAEESDGCDSANEMVVPDNAAVEVDKSSVFDGSVGMVEYGVGAEFDDSGEDSDGQCVAQDEKKNFLDGQDPMAQFFPGIAERTGQRNVVEAARPYDLSNQIDSE